MRYPDKDISIKTSQEANSYYCNFTGKAVSQMWMNSGDPTKLMQPNIPEEEEVDDEDMGVAETYADYMPTKRTINV